jgi:hypothetical protein
MPEIDCVSHTITKNDYCALLIIFGVDARGQ